jgi:hypothetical protein
MDKKKKNFILNAIGILLILFFVFRFICLVRDDMLVDVLWLCNHTPLILGTAILFRNSFWITAEISFLFFGVIGWVIDYLSKVIFDFHLLGSTDYLFPITNLEFFYVTSAVHLLTLPLAVFALMLIRKPEPSAWKGAVFHGAVLFPFVYLAGEENNINCLFEPCTGFISDFSFYPAASILGYFILVFALNKLIVWIVEKR